MAFTATSPMVVDLSGDNDSAGALAAAATIPSTNPDSPFERSCDNPECSAPKLISLVPKRETPEFISEPVIMNQPTLINGFTTVFQIDGIGAKMNDIMCGDQAGISGPSTSNSIGAPLKPKSVFRIVPNTHAHIVNYVVVDGAGETMRKIKANDADTMRKLLDSQRLSAEQMLKKLIGKAFKTPSRPLEPQVPQPIKSKVPLFVTPASVPVPISGPLPATKLPTVPPGITITPIPFPKALQIGKPVPVSAQASIVPHIGTTIASQLTSSHSSTLTTSTAATTPILRQALATATVEATQNAAGRPNVLKRKLVSAPIPETVKRLRSSSPKQKTPLATGLISTATTPPEPTKKLPTLPKLPTKAPVPAAIPLAQSTPQPKKKEVLVPLAKAITNFALKEIESGEEYFDSTTEEDTTSQESEPLSTKEDAELMPVLPAEKPMVASMSTNETLLADTLSVLKGSDSFPVKIKPRMGPASKMNALKANTTQGSKAEAPTSNPSVTRIGETVITSTCPLTPKVDVTTLPKTKPCSVSIPKADICNTIKANTNEYLCKEKALPTSKTETMSVSKPNANPIKLYVVRSPKTNATSIKLVGKISSDEDPLILDTSKSDATSKVVKPSKIAEILESDDVLTTITPKSDLQSASKTNVMPFKTSAASTSKVEVLPAKVTRSSTPKTSATLASAHKTNLHKTDGPPCTRSNLSLTSKAIASKQKTASTSKVDETSGVKALLKSDKLLTKVNTSVATAPVSKTTTTSSNTKTEPPVAKATRSSTPKTNLTTKSVAASSKSNETTTPCSTAILSQSRSLRVVLPTLKSGVLTIPVRSPHPNLKIASVISGGTAVAAATLGTDTKPTTMKASSNESGPDIEKLQKELLDLRRTVARLSKRKT